MQHYIWFILWNLFFILSLSVMTKRNLWSKEFSSTVFCLSGSMSFPLNLRFLYHQLFNIVLLCLCSLVTDHYESVVSWILSRSAINLLYTSKITFLSLHFINWLEFDSRFSWKQMNFSVSFILRIKIDLNDLLWCGRLRWP